MDWFDKNQLAGAVLDALTASICVLDISGNIVAVNEAWRRFSAANSGCGDYVGVNYVQACERAEGEGKTIAEEIGRAVRDVLSGRRALLEMEYPCPSAEEQRWFLLRVTELRNARGDRIGAVVSHQDVTSRRLLEERLKQLAETDELTGLPNRRRFLRSASEALQKVKKFQAQFSVIVLDLDHFKQVNDNYGHEAGDETLRQLADQMSRMLRQGDTLARFGGEEFVILLPDTDEWGAVLLAERLRTRIECYSVETRTASVHATASFGVTQLLARDVDMRTALARADTALYEAKEDGRNRVRAFSAEANASVVA